MPRRQRFKPSRKPKLETPESVQTPANEQSFQSNPEIRASRDVVFDTSDLVATGK